MKRLLEEAQSEKSLKSNIKDLLTGEIYVHNSEAARCTSQPL